MFEVGDFVDALIDCSYPDGIGNSRIVKVVYRGRVWRLLSENRAVIRFSIPHQPAERNVCDHCGFPGMLSRNGATGEIVCMRSGCGHEHGFEEWDQTFPLDQLVNIAAQGRAEKKTKFNTRLADLLREGVNESLISPLTMDKILKLAGSLPS